MDRKRILGRLELQHHDLMHRLMEPGEPIRRIYFPLTALACILTRLDDGSAVEVATIGNDGMVGATAFLGARTVSPRDLCQIQVPGEILAMDIDAFREEAQNGAFRGVLERYVQAYLRQVSQQVACNATHPLVERCSRWILLTHDGVGRDEFPLTQEFLSQMLGVRRASVTVAAGQLQEAGLIRFRRGCLTILDREGLESAACECHGITRSEFDRLLSDRR